MTQRTFTTTPMTSTIGIDLGDRKSHTFELAPDGSEARGVVPTTEEGFSELLVNREPCLVVIEVSTHSPWVSRLVRRLGHRCVVADARRLPLISKGARKNDRADAEILARLARADLSLLNPITHRHEGHQADLAVLRARAALVESRTRLINHVRSVVKSVGRRVPSGIGADSFAKKAREHVPEELEAALVPILEQVSTLTSGIKHFDGRIEALSGKKYPETGVLRRVPGVGPVIALYYVLVLSDPNRFEKSRNVGPYLGVVPRQRQSCGSDPELSISKTGDRELRRLLVIAANYVLGRGPDCDLKRWGEKLAARGGKNARKRAKVAVARRLAVLMHHLWKTGEQYDPFHLARQRGESIPAEAMTA